ncbi:MAG: hypothetical protein HYV36_08800, partial [Lentisphaerae bacterium]|nr:hypothetical protein [Lentisphaerota bacterium]
MPGLFFISWARALLLGTLLACTVLGAARVSAAESSAAESEDAITFYGVAEKIRGFDPVMAGDVASALAISRIYEGLLQYAYLKRPYALEPCLAAALPEVSPDGLTYTFQVRRGIYFQDDQCFTATHGQGRELTASDFVYALKRVADLKTGSTGFWAFNDRLVGLDEFRAASAGEQPTDYDLPVEGLSAPERFTFRIRLKRPYPQLIWIMTMHYTFAVPREAVEFYGADFVNHPVGTGPYLLKSWKKNYRLEYVRNPKWAATGRIERYPAEGAPGDEAQGLLRDAGVSVPIIDRVVQYVVGDSSTMWFLFLKGQFEMSGISRDNWNAVISAEKTLNRDLAQKGIRMYSAPVMETYYIGFNMDDEVVGTNKLLRQALTCAFNSETYVEFYNQRIIRAKGPLPPTIAGFEEQRTPYPFDLSRARSLLEQAGYPEGKDPRTLRRLKLTIDLGNANDPELRAAVELFADFMGQIGVLIVPVYNNWPAFLERIERRQAQLFRLGWVADYPDAENFLQLFYGANSSPGPNHSNYRNKEFDTLYERVRVMPDSPERTELYRKMAALVVEDCPWLFEQHPLAYGLTHAWLRNYKP